MNEHLALCVHALYCLRRNGYNDEPTGAKIDAAITWLQQVEADAGRYRWLRKDRHILMGMAFQTPSELDAVIDAAIDAAMKGDQDANKR